MKYSLSQGSSRGLRLYFTVYPTGVIIQTLSISINLISRIGFPQEDNTERVDSPYCPRSWGYIFQYCPVSDAIQVHIGQVKKSAVATLKNTLSRESNTDTVSVLGRDEGYTVKYSPPPMGVAEGEARGNS